MSEHETELAWTRRSKEHVHLIAQARCRSCVEREAECDRLQRVAAAAKKVSLPKPGTDRTEEQKARFVDLWHALAALEEE